MCASFVSFTVNWDAVAPVNTSSSASRQRTSHWACVPATTASLHSMAMDVNTACSSSSSTWMLTLSVLLSVPVTVRLMRLPAPDTMTPTSCAVATSSGRFAITISPAVNVHARLPDEPHELFQHRSLLQHDAGMACGMLRELPSLPSSTLTLAEPLVVGFP